MISTAVLLALSLSAAPAPIKVATMRLNLVDQSESKADFYTDHLSDRLGEQGLNVTSPREVAAILGMERQKQLLGCSEGSSCLAEIANALGVDGLVMGDIAKIGSSYQVNLKVIDSQTGKKLATFSAMVGSEPEVVTTMTLAAAKLANDVAASVGRPLGERHLGTTSVSQTSTSAGGARRFWWIPAIVAAGGVALAVIELLSAQANLNALVANNFSTPADGQAAYTNGVTARTLGYTGIGVGIAGLAAMGALLIWGSDAPVTPVAFFAPGTAGLAFSGVFR
jgi:hypothetical protein